MKGAIVNSTDNEIADVVLRASNISTKYNVTHSPSIKYRKGDMKYLFFKSCLKKINPPKKSAVIENLITVTISGDSSEEIMLPKANDPAINAEKHSIARCPLSSEVIKDLYSAAKALGLLG